MRHLGRESPGTDVVSTLPSLATATDQDGLSLDTVRAQVRGQNDLGEFFLRRPFHRNGKANHGRPPRRFFCQSSPGVKLSSSHVR